MTKARGGTLASVKLLPAADAEEETPRAEGSFGSRARYTCAETFDIWLDRVH